MDAWRISSWISIVDNGMTRRASLKYIVKMDKILFYKIHFWSQLLRSGKIPYQVHSFPTIMKCGIHKYQQKDSALIWSLYHKVMIVNTWKVKVNHFFDISCSPYRNHSKNTHKFSLVNLPQLTNPWVNVKISFLITMSFGPSFIMKSFFTPKCWLFTR